MLVETSLESLNEKYLDVILSKLSFYGISKDFLEYIFFAPFSYGIKAKICSIFFLKLRIWNKRWIQNIFSVLIFHYFCDFHYFHFDRERIHLPQCIAPLRLHGS